jgi:hypothetical protein
MRRSPSFAGAILCALACVAVSTATAQTAAPKKSTTTTTSPAPTKAPAASKAPGSKGTSARTKTAPRSKPKSNELQEVDWRTLLPEKERKRYSAKAPAPIHGPLGEGGPPALQTVTTTVNDELDQARVRMPGFLVPIGTPVNGLVKEFFLVPYIGECIHVPPPPSNQMVYVRSGTGVAAEAVHEAYWVTGKMRVETQSTALGTSAYSLVAEKVEQYQY